MKTPEKGFYYHYKHDPQKDINNYSYEVLGTALHSEDRGYGVVYRPLYKNTFLEGADFIIRPLEMFMGTVEREGNIIPRFIKITDTEIISRLKSIRDQMYR
jgi:hypothetical protein